MESISESISFLFILFLLFFSVVWIILYSLDTVLTKKEDGTIDSAKCFVGSLIISLLLTFIYYMIGSNNGMFIIFFLIFIIIWIILYSFKPTMVRNIDDACAFKCFYISIIISSVIFIIIILVKFSSDLYLTPMSEYINVLFILFLVFFSFIWICFYSFKPKIVKYIAKNDIEPKEDAPADPVKCFVAALLLSLLVIIIVWMFKSCR